LIDLPRRVACGNMLVGPVRNRFDCFNYPAVVHLREVAIFGKLQGSLKHWNSWLLTKLLGFVL
jgi:hypothetical protein